MPEAVVVAGEKANGEMTGTAWVPRVLERGMGAYGKGTEPLRVRAGVWILRPGFQGCADMNTDADGSVRAPGEKRLQA